MADVPTHSLQLRSCVTADGVLQLSLAEVEIGTPAPDEVIVRMEAAPLNPSDLGLLLAGADVATAELSGTPDRPVVTATVPEQRRGALAARFGVSMPVGNEGAGIVVRAGAAPEAQQLLGRAVAVFSRESYGQYSRLPAAACLPLPEGLRPAEGAAAFVNPLTALGMIETMKREGHRALVFTAAASNLGQMVNRLCRRDGIAIVNIVRSAQQVEILRALGAEHVCDSSAPGFMDALTDAIAETGATLGFDAIGGGDSASRILSAMEAALNREMTGYQRYGSSTHKQVYIYGRLDPRPAQLALDYGLAWGVGGWLLTPFLASLDPAAIGRLRERVAAEITTTFASHYGQEIGLREALRPDVIAAYSRQATGAKYLINPAR